MLKSRIIPKLLLKDGRCVKGKRFVELRDVGHPVTNARIYEAQGADELLLLDIAASSEGRPPLLDVVTQAAREVLMPLCVGGGIRNVADIRALLLAGADKVAINTAAVRNPAIIEDGAKLFGSQCLVVAIDFRRVGDEGEVFTHGGAEPTGLDVLDQARRLADAGAGELLLTAIDRDGTMTGYDLEITQAVAGAVSVPVIASGGAGTLAHLAEAIQEGGASAVAVGSLFHFTDQSPIKARTYLRGAGVEVRV
jgi:cyclase